MEKQYGVLGAVYQWSHNINGRFFSNFLLSLGSMAFKSMIVYKSMPIVVVFLFFVVVVYCIKSAFVNIFERLETVALSALIVASYFVNMPSLYEGLYWLSAVSNYEISVLMFIFIIVWQKKIGTRFDFFYAVIIFLMSFLAAALNELMTVMFIGLIAAYICLDTYKKSSISWPKLVILIASTLSLFFQLTSSGNRKRASLNDYTHSWSIAKSSLMAVEQTIFHLIKHSILSPLWWLAGLFFFALLLQHNTKLKSKFSYVNNRLIFLVFLFMAGMFFLPALVFGNLERSLSGMRIINVSYLVSFIGLLFLVFGIVLRLSITINPNRMLGYQIFLLFVTAIAIVWLPGNFKYISKDLFSGNASLYNNEAYNRYKLIENCKMPVCVVPPYTNPPLSLCPIADNRINIMRLAVVFGKEKIVVTKDSLSKKWLLININQ